MKKLFVTISILGFICIDSVYAQSNTPTAVLTSFHKSFSSAANESWSTVKDLYRVDFTSDDEKISAFFNDEGKLIASSRNVTLLQIPLSLKSDLKKNFDDYEVASIFEVDKEDGTIYYATIKNSKKQLALESTSSGDWVEHRKITDN